MKKIISFSINISLLILSLVFILFIGEILCRAYFKLIRGIPFNQSPNISYNYDKELGWQGKIIFGDVTTKKYKILIIGDSFTDGCGVEEEDMYYNVIRKSLNAETFICSGKGYGTLQEYIALDKYLGQIKPDLIILQVHPNDFINNLWQLECASFFNNSFKIRPYFINGKIECRFPRPLGGLGVFLLNHSRLFYCLSLRLERFYVALVKIGILHSVEEKCERQGLNFINFYKAVTITNELVAKIKSRAARIPIVAFTVKNRHIEQFASIFKTNNIEFVENVPNKIKIEESEYSSLKLADGEHWNSKGQRICGEVLVQELIRRGFYSVNAAAK